MIRSSSALKRTSADRQRVDANLIAQDRMEQIRLLQFTDITQANLNLSPSPAANPFGDGVSVQPTPNTASHALQRHVPCTANACPHVAAEVRGGDLPTRIRLPAHTT